MTDVDVLYRRVMARERYRKDPQKYLDQQKEWRQKNPDKVRESRHKYRQTHREQYNAYRRELAKRKAIARKIAELEALGYEVRKHGEQEHVAHEPSE